jgi:hypothetical protein
VTSFDGDSRLYALVLAYLLARRGGSALVRIVAPAVLAGLVLVKFSAGVAALLALGLAGLEDLTRRRAPVPWCAAAAALVGLWLLCRQPLVALPAFLRGSLLVAGGYPEGLSLGSDDGLVDVGLLASAAACTAFAALRGGLPGDRRQVVVGGAGLLAVGGLLVRAGLVRQDAGHVLLALAAFAAAYCLVAVRARGRWTAPVALVVAATFLLGLGRTQPGPVAAVGRRCLEAPLRLLVGALALVDGRRDAERAAALEEVRRLHPIAARARGRVDLYPARFLVALAPGLDYAPRPVWQSYAAFTPELLERNTARLRGESPPDSVLVQLDPVDGHLATQEDGPSWPLLRAGYDVVGRDEYTLLLARRAAPRRARVEPLSAARVGFGALVEVPPGGPVWATIDVQPTLTGRALRAAWKAPPLILQVNHADGVATLHRFVRATGRAGFVLSPAFRTFDDLVTFFEGGPPAPQAIATHLFVTVEGGTSAAYEPAFEVTLGRLVLEEP